MGAMKNGHFQTIEKSRMMFVSSGRFLSVPTVRFPGPEQPSEPESICLPPSMGQPTDLTTGCARGQDPWTGASSYLAGANFLIERYFYFFVWAGSREIQRPAPFFFFIAFPGKSLTFTAGGSILPSWLRNTAAASGHSTPVNENERTMPVCGHTASQYEVSVCSQSRALVQCRIAAAAL